MDLLRSNWLLLAILSAVFAALTTIFGKIGVQGAPSNLATAIRTVVILLLAWAIAAGTGELAALPRVPQRTWIFLLLSGLTTGLSWLCYFAALQKGPTGVVAAVDKTSLAMIFVLAALFLGEPLTPKTALGGGLAVLGALIAAWK